MHFSMIFKHGKIRMERFENRFNIPSLFRYVKNYDGLFYLEEPEYAQDPE